MASIRPNQTPTSEGSTSRTRHPLCISTSIKHTKQKEQDHLRGLVRQTRVPLVREKATTRMDDLTAIATHQPCPDCGSSDALTHNSDGSTKCYSCGIFTPNRDKQDTTTQHTKMENVSPLGFVNGKFMEIAPRGIHKDTCVKYGYQIGELNGKPCHVANYRNLDGTQVAQKYRFADKSFHCNGSPNYFFGQNLWPNGGKKLVITEGEIDCLTVSQLQGNKWPVVSLPSGAQSAKTIFKKQLEWLSSWDEVVVMFDEDKAGREAAESVAHILPAGTCKIARLSMKDPNEMLLANKGEEVIQAFWNAKVWRPDDIVDGSELYDRLTVPKENDSIPYPYYGLNSLTHGLRKGEIVTFCAGSGIGKSAVCKEIALHVLKTTDRKLGYIALEESIERTANGIIGLEMSKPLHLEPFEPDAKYNDAYKKTVGSGRFYLYDHWGSLDSDNLLGHIRYMAKAMDVDYVVLDHLSIIVSGMGDGDERRMIDNTMTKLRALVEETKIGVVLVSHLKRPEGKGHEEGAATSLAQLRGSAAIAQLSDMCIGLERNQQDIENKNRTTLRVLKNRFSGETGVACNLLYDKETCRLSEDTNPLFEDTEDATSGYGF